MADLLVNFGEDISSSEANQLAAELQEYLKDNGTEQVEIVKEKDNTMDFGATLAIVLSSGAAIALAKGIADWLRKKNAVKITIKTKGGEIIGENITSNDISKFTEAMKSL